MILLPLILSGQNLKCCKTIKEVETHLSGKWKIENSDSETILHFWFENGKGHMNKYVYMKNGKTRKEEKDQPLINVYKDEGVFYLEFQYLFGGVGHQIIYLDSKRLILPIDGTEIEYYKIE